MLPLLAVICRSIQTRQTVGGFGNTPYVSHDCRIIRSSGLGRICTQTTTIITFVQCHEGPMPGMYGDMGLTGLTYMYLTFLWEFVGGNSQEVCQACKSTNVKVKTLVMQSLYA